MTVSYTHLDVYKRQPLNAIVGFSDLLSDTSGFTSEEIAQFIGTINKNCGLLLALINDIPVSYTHLS